MMRVVSNDKPLTDFAENLQRHARAMKWLYQAGVAATRTTGKYKRARGPDKVEVRLPKEHVKIIRIQKGSGRDVIGHMMADRGFMRTMNDVWFKASQQYTRSMTSTTGGDSDPTRFLVRASVVVSEKIKVAIEEIIRSGAMKPVAPSTQKKKDRQGIAVGLPPLMFTGQLVNSLAEFVKKIPWR